MSLKEPLRRAAHHPLGRKQIFLPNFTLTLLRTPKLPPTFAQFLVPLNLNKLDLRDYLFNAYSLPVRNVRSFIQQQKMRQDTPGSKRPAPRKWFRPRSIKKMLVEMDQPFVWPDAPEDFSPWDKSTFEGAQKEREAMEGANHPTAREKPTGERSAMSAQAKGVLQGRHGRKALRTAPDIGEWVDDGEMVEVETDIDVTKTDR